MANIGEPKVVQVVSAPVRVPARRNPEPKLPDWLDPNKVPAREPVPVRKETGDV